MYAPAEGYFWDTIEARTLAETFYLSSLDCLR